MMQFIINGKPVDFSHTLGHAKPWGQWTTGELRVLDRLGYALTGRDATREALTWDDLAALVTYFAMKSNRTVTPADINALTTEQFLPMARIALEQFIPKMFPAPKDSGESEEPRESPFPPGSGAAPSSSPELPAGPQT